MKQQHIAPKDDNETHRKRLKFLWFLILPTLLLLALCMDGVIDFEYEILLWMGFLGEVFIPCYTHFFKKWDEVGKGKNSMENYNDKGTVVVATYNNQSQAIIAKGLLEANGIKCFLKDEFTIGSVKLCVLEHNAKDARQLLRNRRRKTDE